MPHPLFRLQRPPSPVLLDERERIPSPTKFPFTNPLQTNSGDFHVPAKLASSNFMTALSSISDTDYVGPDSSAASLALPSWSGIHLLTECDHFPDGTTECTDPAYGFTFSPSHHLRLDATSLQGIASPDLQSALSHYSRASRWLSSAYIASTVFSLLAPIESFFTPLFAAFTSGLATLFLLAASITATVIFKKVVDAFNAQFAEYALTASLGTYPIAFGFVACVLSLGATVAYTAAHMRQQRAGRGRAFGGDKGFVHGGAGAGGDSEYHGAAALGATRSKNGLFNRVTGTGHRYVQIDEQQQQHAAGGDLGERPLQGRAGERGAPGSPDGIRPSRLDEDWAAPDDYAGGSGVGGGAGTKSAGPGASIPLMTLGGNKQTKDLNTVYEPYSEPR